MNWLNAPNLLTLCRLLLAPAVVALIVSGRHVAAGLTFAAAAFTDILDGAAARRLHSVTPAGQYLDPIADKALMSGIFVALAWIGSVPLWFVAIVFGRDILLLIASAIAMRFTDYGNFRPSVWGKLSTFLQIVAAVFVMAANAFPSGGLTALAHALLWPSAAATLWSALDYTRRGVSYFRKR